MRWHLVCCISIDYVLLSANNILGTLRPEKMVTGKIALHEVVEKGLLSLINDSAGQVKILVDIQQGEQ